MAIDEGYVDKEMLIKKGFRRMADGRLHKLNALELLAERGWLDFGNPRFNATDRVSVGNRLASDFRKSKLEGVTANDVSKVRVDGCGSYITPEYVVAAEDRYVKALKAVPASCRVIVRRVCLDEGELVVEKPKGRRKFDRERVAMATQLCVGLDELIFFYLKKYPQEKINVDMDQSAS